MGKASVSDRIARIIENDAGGEIKRTVRVLQSDIAALLSEFMSLAGLDVTVEKAGERYVLKMTATADRFYDVGKTTECE